MARFDISGMVWAAYRPGITTQPVTPWQQLCRHLARQAGVRRVRPVDVVLSVTDGTALSIRTRAFAEAWGASPALAVQPTVSLHLPHGTAEITS